MTSPAANCRLRINGRATQAVISPHVSQNGFLLWNDAPGAREHFSLEPCPAVLRDLLLQHAGQSFEVELFEKSLGQVDEYRGYAAADMGPYSRRVLSLTFALSHRSGVIAFRLAGVAGPVDPGWIFQDTETDHTRSGYRFEIEFDIADEVLERHVVDPVALQAIEEYVASVA